MSRVQRHLEGLKFLSIASAAKTYYQTSCSKEIGSSDLLR
jgi:hypothetical protein